MLSTLWSDGALVIEEGLHPKAPHQHHAVQLSIALDGLAYAALDGSRHELPFGALVIAPNRRHALRGRLLSLLFEPHGPSGLWLWQLAGGGGFQRLDHPALAAFTQQLGLPGLIEPSLAHPTAHFDLSRAEQAALELVQALWNDRARRLSSFPVAGLDDRVAEVRARLRSAPGARVELAELADEVRLSPSRLRHLFADQMGLPIRNYVLWLRTTAGLVSLLGGASVGGAAHQVGFADQAAFSRSYRTIWGIAPSTFSRVVHFPEAGLSAQRTQGGWLSAPLATARSQHSTGMTTP